MLHLAVVVMSGGIQGMGLFASREIAAGEVVWQPEPHLTRFHMDVINSWPMEKQKLFLKYSIQVGEDWHMGYETGHGTEPWTYVNHSCDPSTWWGPDTALIARRPIAQGEEITFDYATSEIRPDFRLVCECGSPLCRHVITPKDYQNYKSMRERFGQHVLPHVLRTLQQDAPLRWRGA